MSSLIITKFSDKKGNVYSNIYIYHKNDLSNKSEFVIRERVLIEVHSSNRIVILSISRRTGSIYDLHYLMFLMLEDNKKEISFFVSTFLVDGNLIFTCYASCLIINKDLIWSQELWLL